MDDKLAVVFRDEPESFDTVSVREITESTGFFRPDEVEVAVELVEERLSEGIASDYYFWFADLDGKTIGYACYGPTPCTIGSYDLYWIAVDAEFQGQGLGLALEAKVEESIRMRGGKRLYADTSGKAQYRSTRDFYARAGYSQAAVLPDFYDDGDDKVIYQKSF